MGTESFPVLTDTGLNGHYESTNDIIIQSSTTLHSSVRWLASRKSSTTVCTQVERNGESPVAGVHHIRRLSDPMVFQTNPMAAQKNDIYNRRTSSRRFSSGEAPSSRDNREISFSIKAIPLQLLYDPRTYQKASNSRLPKTQQVRPMLTLQNGRFERCVRGRTNARRTKTFPFISSQGHRLPISLTGFRVERGTESLFKADAVCNGTTPETRLQFQHQIDENQDSSGEVEQNYTALKTGH
ncbi:hypothetical protein G6F70_007490 [Rhizopus microsporus]|nr:hypothetical protein G6F71_008134 [Rhizopus microsporus]KAG1196378.1 hypothetical protein G6F70_007490 [Rhizopus microsporus]KAG1208119.1 hypothetical protein G6F69_007486 [Rhizopus microsporus]KAG1229324.1 hypothetical protein G6F67_007236 [Rhizopus microsporus]KAG1260079.1 hypothetical protein G6F68_007682 [Rhizopus microsporus]